MRTAVSCLTFKLDTCIREAAEQVKQAGYQGIELVLSSESELNMDISDMELTSIGSMIEDMGLKVSAVAAWDTWSHNLVGCDKKEVQAAKDIVKKTLDCAEALGANSTLIFPGWVGTGIDAAGIVPYDVAYSNLREALIELAPYAENAGVHLGIENIWNKFLLSPLEVKRLLDEVGSDYVGMYFDVGNVIYIGYPDQWINILGKKYIKNMHFCDYRANGAGLSGFVDLLEGDVDFTAVMQAVHDIDYQGWATVEFCPNYRTFPYQSIINARLSLDRILNIK